MNENTTRIVLTVAICVGILVIWPRIFPQKPPPNQNQQSQTKNASKNKRGKSDSQTASDSGKSKGKAGNATVKKAEDPKAGKSALRLSKSLEGNHTTLDWKAGNATVTFTDRGASLRHVTLKNPRYQEKIEGKLQPIDLVRTQPGFFPFFVGFKDSDFEIPPDAAFKLVHKGERDVRYEWESDKVRVSKHYVLDEKRSLAWMTIAVRNLLDKPVRHRMEVKLYSKDSPSSKASITNPYPRIATGLCFANGELFRRSARAVTGQESGCSAAGCGMGSGAVQQISQGAWVGTDDRYFLSALVPQDASPTRRCEINLISDEENLVEVSLLDPERQLAAGKRFEAKFAIFLGAKDVNQLDAVGAGKESVDLGESLDFGWVALIARPLLALLKGLESFVGSWGLAIILLTLIVKGATLPWTHKSMKSMRNMQRLKPKFDALRQKYKDDKARLNQETMALYKLHRVNPLGGCLPMLIQMPIWFALYRTLGNAQELYRSGFGGWIGDLTAPDPFYVLPIATGATMFIQQMISPQPLEGAQAKMMKYMMPGMFMVMTLWLPAGLTLYIFVNTLLSMSHQYYINKKDPLPQHAGKGKGETPTGTQDTQRRKPKSTGVGKQLAVSGAGEAAVEGGPSKRPQRQQKKRRKKKKR